MDLVPDLHLKENLSTTEDTEATEDGRKIQCFLGVLRVLSGGELLTAFTR